MVSAGLVVKVFPRAVVAAVSRDGWNAPETASTKYLTHQPITTE